MITSALLLAGLAAFQAPLPDVYQIDRAHGSVGFSVRLAGFNRVRGAFDRFEGHLTWDSLQPQRNSVTFAIDVRSVDTGNEERDNHIRGEAFFDIARFPSIRFRSTRVEPAATGFTVVGDLTIRDVTREVRLPVEVVSGEATDPFGNRRVAFATQVTINRKDFGVNGPAFWNRAISDAVEIELDIPGRIWDYTQLSFAGPRRMSVGRYLLARRDTVGLASAVREVRGFWDVPSRDSLYVFGAFEFEKAAGRLAQAGQLADAAQILALGAETIGRNSGAEASWLLALRAQLEAKQGRREAAQTLALAIAADSTNTLALELARRRN